MSPLATFVYRAVCTVTARCWCYAGCRVSVGVSEGAY